MVGLTYITTPIGRIRIEDDGAAVTVIQFEEPEDVLQPEQTDVLAGIAARQLNEYFEGRRNAFDFPFQQPGTAFQQKVWHELLSIPSGSTISYLALAKRLQDEKCIRAAASANGKNRLAIVVPCHRVIGSNGTLVGYAGGLWRKKWLLEHEQKMSGNLVQQSLFT